jgi:predicted anti-sigma-YlaC factor YlaD
VVWFNAAMDCEAVQSGISALADGEEPGITQDELRQHVQGCASCRAFAKHLQPLDTPDAGDVFRSASRHGGSRWQLLRVLLVLVAVSEIVFAINDLLTASDEHHGHITRHLAAFAFAYGVGLAAVALRPERARAYLPLTVALAGAMILGAIVDIARHDTPVVGELQHTVEVAGLILVWLIAARKGWRSDGAYPPRGRPIQPVVHSPEDGWNMRRESR